MRDLLFNVYKIGTSHTCITCADPDYFIGRVVNPIRGEIVFVGEGLEVGSRPFSVNLQSQFNKFQFSRGRFGLSHAPTPEIRDCMHHHIWIFLTANHSLLQQLLEKIYFKQIHCLILKPYKHHESQNSSSQLSQWFLISSALHKQVTLIEFVAYWVH